jgi:hypothetical protein
MMSAGHERFSMARVLTVGGALCCLVPVMAHLSIDIVHASYLAIDFMPVAAIFLYFLLVFVGNTGLRAVRRSWAFTRPELTVVYAMLLLCASITEMGLMAQLIPMMGAPLHYATRENRWETLVQPYIPGWLMPGPEAVHGLFLGLPPGASIPWGEWIRPLGAWLIFLAPACFVMVAGMAILRKQWADNEHLLFPLTVLPAAMSEAPEGDGLLGGFFRTPGMWLGFGAVFLLTSLTALNSYWDAVPTVRLTQQISLFRNTTGLIMTLSFPVLGLAFLINRDLAFSLWFFNLVFFWIRGTLHVTGVRLDENLGGYDAGREPILAYLCLGAILAYTVAAMFNAREHLRGVWRAALGRQDGADDSGEILSYRTAVWGTLASLVIMLVWLSRVGLPPLVAALYLVVVYLLFLGLTRIVSEGGVPTLRLMMTAPIAVMSMVGCRAIGAAGLMGLALMYVWCVDTRIFPMAEAAQGLKLAEACPPRRRRGVFWAMAVALAIGFVVSAWISLKLAYTHGGITLNRWYFVSGPQVPFRFMAEKSEHPSAPSLVGYGLTTAGAVVTVLIVWLRTRFAGFMLHPIGFAVGPQMLMDQLWFSFFLAWLVKSLILRYGGAHVYRRAVPFFLGLVLGQYTAAAFWFVVDLCTGKTGNVVFWI